MITSDSVRKDPVPIKYYNNNIYNIANNDNVEALSRDKAILYASKKGPYKDEEFEKDLDHILSQGIEIPADYEIIEIN